MITIPIYVNGVEQGVCELTDNRRYIIEKLLDNHTLSPEEMVKLQSVWCSEYDPKDKVEQSITKIDYFI